MKRFLNSKVLACLITACLLFSVTALAANNTAANTKSANTTGTTKSNKLNDQKAKPTLTNEQKQKMKAETDAIKSKIDSLTEAQKNEITAIFVKSSDAQKALIDIYSGYGLINADKAAAIKSKIDEMVTKVKDEGKVPAIFGGMGFKKFPGNMNKCQKPSSAQKNKPTDENKNPGVKNLTDKQKSKIYTALEQIISYQKEIIDKYAEFGVITSEKANEIKTNIDQRFESMKDKGVIPPAGFKGGMHGKGHMHGENNRQATSSAK